MRAAARASCPAPFAAGLAITACAAGPDYKPPAGVALEEVFETEAVITLGEDPQDSIATPGIFAERVKSGFLLSDGRLPRIRSYHEDGRLAAAFGRFGEGPFEFQGINGLAETASGKIAVLGSRSGRLTYLTGELEPDTTVQLPGVPRGVIRMGDDLLVGMMRAAERPQDASRFFRRPLLLHRLTDNEVAWSAYRYPFVPAERPYWISLVVFPFAVAGDSIYTASSVRYPVAVLNTAGDSIGEIGVPPASFDPLPVFEPGALAPGAYANQIPNLLGGHSTISQMAVVGSHLIVVHGRFGSEVGFTEYHSSLDIYDRHTGRKLYEDVPLPENSQILGGGRHLYLLADTRFPPWRIVKLSLREESPG